MNTIAVIMAGGRGKRLGILSQNRPESALPFAGKYRVVDFALSNCVNSDIFNVGILTQYQPHSLNDHIRTGRPWDLDRTLSGGVTLLPPYQRQGGCLDWYHGTADAVYQNLDFIQRHKTDTVLVLSGDQVYQMDYEPLLHFHHQRRADVTVCVANVPLERASQFGILDAGENGRVVKFEEKPSRPSSTLASMGIYVFRTDVLVQRLNENAARPDSTHDFGWDVLPQMLALGDRFYAYPFESYWMDVDSVEAYWQAHMDLLQANPSLDLQGRRWRIRTRSEERPPVNVGGEATVSNSLITNGCIIQGQVENSVLSPGVRIGPGAVVRDSILFHDCEIGPGAIVERAILDKDVVVGQNAHIGLDENVPHYAPSNGLNPGITLIGKNTRLPAGLCLGRNKVVPGDLSEEDVRRSDLFPEPALAEPEPRLVPRWGRGVTRSNAFSASL